MKTETKYHYEKRIKELKTELAEANDKIYSYRTSAMEIFDGLAEVSGDSVSKNWLLKRLRRCFK